jgi:hypothetical protein
MTDATTASGDEAAIEGLAVLFATFTEIGILADTPVYSALCRAVADEPAMAASLLAAPPTERLPNLLFAAVQSLLRRGVPGSAELAAYYPTLGGSRAPDDELLLLFRRFVDAHHTELRAVTARRTTQTNEARRAAVIRPALAAAQRIAGDRPLALIEVGCSSGLMLLTDRYGYRYRQPSGAVLEFGSAATPELVLEVSVRGAADVPETVAEPVRIASRLGIDRNPIDARDPELTDWLRACVWPEHVERLARLDAALALAASEDLELRRGDLADLLPAAVAEAPEEALVCVLTSHVMPYLTKPERDAFAAQLRELAATRPRVLVLNESRSIAAPLGVVAPPGAEHIVSAVLDFGNGSGAPRAEVLAKVDQHGGWIEWLG